MHIFSIVAFQLSTVFFLLTFFVVVSIYCIRITNEKKTENKRVCGWWIRATRVGKAEESFPHLLVKKRRLTDEILCEEGRYILGNTLTDDIYIDAGRNKVKIHLNILKESVLIAVLDGTVVFQNYKFSKNCSKQTKIEDYGTLVLNDIQLKFIRKEVM